MPHDTADATTCSTEHSTGQKNNQTIPTLSDSSVNCSKFPINLSRILKLEQITENKWKKCEKVKTTKKYEKIAVDSNGKFKESEMVRRVLLVTGQENGRELHSRHSKISSVRCYSTFLLKMLISIL